MTPFEFDRDAFGHWVLTLPSARESVMPPALVMCPIRPPTYCVPITLPVAVPRLRLPLLL
jgi:hypothetical protein